MQSHLYARTNQCCFPLQHHFKTELWNLSFLTFHFITVALKGQFYEFLHIWIYAIHCGSLMSVCPHFHPFQWPNQSEPNLVGQGPAFQYYPKMFLSARRSHFRSSSGFFKCHYFCWSRVRFLFSPYFSPIKLQLTGKNVACCHKNCGPSPQKMQMCTNPLESIAIYLMKLGIKKLHLLLILVPFIGLRTPHEYLIKIK